MRTYDRRWARASPGHLLFLETANAGLLEGIRTVELGRGDEPYKYELGATDGRLRSVTVVRVHP